MRLFGVIAVTAFPDHVDLDLTGIMQFALDGLAEFMYEQRHLLIRDTVR